MSKNRKIPAFTVAELLVVLVVSSLLISLALLSLSLVQKQFNLMEKRIEKNNSVILLERLMWQDSNKYMLFYDLKTNQIKGYNETDSITYSFNDTTVIRNQDTIAVAITKKQFFLNGVQTKSSVFDAMSLRLEGVKPEKELFIIGAEVPSHYYINQIAF